ncbi:Protein phosphatase 2C like protein C10F6.17c [Daldinia childiae]|uniref:Protein phosphatase 2C like protein C10F6.17c n=1 Tax=Daldinia childiae TaxID=326645 RepID=UPI0014484E55|nr:Protein phosphatase 2C like protein C10F6.17c [Daldinia childiae]KAF3064466.1 Protein phosphatase 2C like protein C10F6.17c [Daldinia childiae]
MFFSQLLRQRPRLTTITRLAHLTSRPLARFASTGAQAKPFSTGTVAVSFAAGLASATTVYWFTSRSSQTQTQTPGPAEASSALNDKGNGIPDLNKLGLSDQIAYSPTPTSEDVTRQLNEHAFSVPGGGKPVRRYDGAQLASNSPCEDAFIHGSFSNPLDKGNEDWLTWGVFDGHCGWQLSNLLTKQLIPYVRNALGNIKPKDGNQLSDEDIQEAIKSAFTTLDDTLVKSAVATINGNLSFAEKVRRLEAAYAGSCALLALLDPQSRKLTVASTGDCRAVLGQKTADGKWAATELTTDCTGATPSEIARIQAQFPDEPEIVKGGRVWGMQPSRTFGDGMWKWPAALKETLRDYYNGLSLPSAVRYGAYKEGPYLTAEPLVTTTKIPESGPSFVILATDGLWDAMTSEQAVDLVGKWIEWQAQGQGKPVKPRSDGFGEVVLGRKQQCRFEEQKLTLQDSNAAVHLVRNGLGGGDENMVQGALTFRYPNSRDIRDDITVQVVFFAPATGKGGK